MSTQTQTQTIHPIRAARKKLGLTLDDLAHAADLSISHLSGIERRERGLSIDAARRIGHALGVPWQDLIED